MPQGPGQGAYWSAEPTTTGGTALITSVFDLPHRLASKAAPALIAGDELHFTDIARNLEQTVADVSDRLDTVRKHPPAWARRPWSETWRPAG